MSLSILDWCVIIFFFLLIVTVGLSYTKRAGKSLENFFLGGRNLPWYIAGVSMVATTFAADTPLAVTELVGTKGIAGNWLWWSFLAGGMLTTFFFARLWRKANVLTEVELTELRYSGGAARFLRGFKAIYLGLFMNVIIIAWVNSALIALLEVFFGLDGNLPLLITAGAMVWVAIYSSLSGLLGVAITDVIQFVLAMVGTIILAIVVVNSPEVGGIAELKTKVSGISNTALNFLPSLQTGSSQQLGLTLGLGISSFFAYAAVQWWASWYPGAEPGGGGYVAQRMMSAKSPKDAVYATLFFQVAHYCLRPWPWIIVALCAVTLYDFESAVSNTDLKEEVMTIQADPSLKASDKFNDKVFTVTDEEDFLENYKDDAAIMAKKTELLRLSNELSKLAESNPELASALTYQAATGKGYVLAMRDFLPNGLKGLLLIAFFGAYMSTISTQLNWGASYLVNDAYLRFLAPNSSPQHQIFISRIFTVLLMMAGLIVTTFVTSISGMWQFLMQCGAGLGLVLILRWYWWRINAWSEIAAMIAPFVATAFFYFIKTEASLAFLYTVAFTTIVWLVVTFLTKPTSAIVLERFYERVQPDGYWGNYAKHSNRSNVIFLFVTWVSGVVMTYSVLFFIGKIILQMWLQAGVCLGVALVGFLVMRLAMKRTNLFEN